MWGFSWLVEELVTFQGQLSSMVLVICMYYYIVFNYLFLYLSLDAPFFKTAISFFVNYILLLLVLESSLILLVEFYYIHAHYMSNLYCTSYLHFIPFLVDKLIC